MSKRRKLAKLIPSYRPGYFYTRELIEMVCNQNNWNQNRAVVVLDWIAERIDDALGGDTWSVEFDPRSDSNRGWRGMYRESAKIFPPTEDRRQDYQPTSVQQAVTRHLLEGRQLLEPRIVYSCPGPNKARISVLCSVGV